MILKNQKFNLFFWLGFITIIAPTLLFSGCRMNKKNMPGVLWKSETFNVYNDSVTDHSFKAQILSTTEIRSNAYQEDRELIFKFCLLSHNDELPLFINHSVLVYPENQHAVIDIKFGKQLNQLGERADRNYFLKENTSVTFRLDMREIVSQIKISGTYNLGNDKIITAKDLDHIYITGNKKPLISYADDCFKNESYHLTDPDGDGIYELTQVFNTGNEKFTSRKSDSVVPGLPTYKSDQLIVDALYNLSVNELHQLERPDGLLNSARDWPGVWTRDNSYSDILAIAYLLPDKAMACLKSRVRNGKIIQDTGTGGSWPVSTDRVVWITAAWEVYKVTGDKQWLKYLLEVAENIVNSDSKVIYGRNGLVMGESSFLDRRRQTYPEWMNPLDIAKSQCLGTNVLHYNAFKIISLARKESGLPVGKYDSLAASLRESVIRNLWLSDKSYFSQYIYGNQQNIVSPRAEALGEALTVLFDLADRETSRKVIANTPVVGYGIPVMFPQTPLSSYYQSDAIWPFVQGYWNWAAAKMQNEKALTHGLAALYRAGALFLTNKENMLASNGRIKGLEGNSDAQLWSLSANLAMVYRVFCGMTFETNALTFNPAVPEVYGGIKNISGFRYRKSELDITIKGYGTQIKSFLLDGNKSNSNSIPGNLQGKHSVEIVLSNNKFSDQSFNLTENLFAPATPEVMLKSNQISWKPVTEAIKYTIWKDGIKLSETGDTVFTIESAGNHSAEFQVSATGKTALVSFLSEAVIFPAKNVAAVLEAEDYGNASSKTVKGTSGKGFIELTRQRNTSVTIPVEITESGNYVFEFRFSNGSGDFTTDDKCALRSLYVDGAYTETMIFPQMGSHGEWDKWEISPSAPMHLSKGKYILTLQLDPFNENINGDVNDAFLDKIEIIKK